MHPKKDYIPFLTFRYCQSWAPLISQNVQTNAAVGIDIGMVDASCEVDLRGLEGIICREVDGQEEDAALERTVTLKDKSVERTPEPS